MTAEIKTKTRRDFGWMTTEDLGNSRSDLLTSGKI